MPSEGSISTPTDIDIVNTVLTRLGQSPISTFGQNTGTGIVFQASYNASRDDLLRQQPWGFAKQWALLSSLEIMPLNLDIIPVASGPGIVVYTAAYQIPNDSLRVFRFSPKDANWRIVGRTLYADAVPNTFVGQPLGLQTPSSNGADNQPLMGSFGPSSQLGIEYIRKVDNPMEWDANFLQCFIWKLMKEMSFGFTGLAQAYKMAKDEYDEALAIAAGVNGIENWPDPFWNSDLNSVRYGYIGVTIEGY